MKIRAGTCSEDVFWDCISEIGWPIQNTNLAKAKLLRSWTPEFCQSFRSIASEKAAAVWRAARSAIIRCDWISADGIDDLCWHVVGLGKASFEAEVSDPRKLSNRIRNGNFQESFSYVIPHTPFTTMPMSEWSKAKLMDLEDPQTDRQWKQASKGDWIMIDTSYYARWAEELLPNVAAFIGALKNPTTAFEVAAIRHACTLVHYFNLIINEKTEEAVSNSELAMRAWWFLYYIAEELGALRKFHVDLIAMSNSMYSGENLINDHREFMGGVNGFPSQKHLKEIVAMEKCA